jgi:hypothetical protein
MSFALNDDRLRCPVCNDRIGVYERIVVRRGDAVGTTSLLRDPRLGQDGEECFHDACHRFVEDCEAGADCCRPSTRPVGLVRARPSATSTVDEPRTP